MLKLLEFQAENFKKLRMVWITPDGHLVQITGPNGAGKTSTVDAVWFLLKGIKGLPAKAVRLGAESMKVSGRIGGDELEFIVTRTLTAGASTPQLTIEMIKGRRDTTPQDFLDRIFDILTFDPLEFIKMSPAAQVAKLRETAKVETDDKYTKPDGTELTGFEAIDALNEDDYKERRKLGLEADALKARIDAMQTLDGLPKEKLDEDAIRVKLEAAGESNRKAQEVFRAKQELEHKARSAAEAIEHNQRLIKLKKSDVEDLEAQLKQARQILKAAEAADKSLKLSAKEAQAAFDAAPAGDPIDIAALLAEQQSAQRTNRAIDAWRRKEELKGEWETKNLKYQQLTKAMDDRNEKKRRAIANAKIPIEGLSFNDSMTEVTYKAPGAAAPLPLSSMGEGEQIRLSAQIGMAANPKLRVLCIRHGEALDESGLKILGQLAAENDFQIWMARVDTTGNVGIVLEDGMVVKRNEAIA